MKQRRNHKKLLNLQTTSPPFLNTQTTPTQPTHLESSLAKPVDTAYEISPSPTDHYLTTSNLDHPSPSILSKLKQKISSQAKRLTDLQLYKALCEKHILQLSPNHPLPITESDITNYTLYHSSSSPEQNKSNISSLINEKSKLMESLRKETIVNEQLRKYNELLKESIDGILLKSNLEGILKKSYMFNNGDNKYANMYDYIISLSRMVNEIDKKEKELLGKDAKIKEMENEVEIIKRELNESEKDVKELKERLNMRECLYGSVMKEKEELGNVNRGLVEEISNEKREKGMLQENAVIEKKQYEHIVETFKKEMESLYAKNKELITKHSELQLNNTDVLNELHETQMEVKQLKSGIEHKERDIHLLHTQIVELNNKIEILTHQKEQLVKENENLDSEIKSLHSSIHQIKETNTHNENKIKTLSNVNNVNSNEFQSLQTKYQQEIHKKNEQCKQFQSEITVLHDQISTLKSQLKQTITENVKHVDTISNAHEIENKLREELKKVVTNNKKLITSHENNIKELKKEIKNGHDNISKNNELTVKVNKLEMDNKRLIKSNSALEEINKCLIAEIDKLRVIMKDNEINNYTIITNKNANVRIIDSCYSVINEYVKRVIKEEQKDKYKVYLSALEEFVEWFRNNKCTISNEEKDKLKIIEMFISMVSTQSEILFRIFDV